ncbi:MAG: hypothetical protein ACRKGH_04785 [Dehalogenimonas sp.]
MKTRLFSILAVTAVLASLLSLGGLVYADSHADAHATANGTSPSTSGYACDDSYAEAMANAAGNISSGVWDDWLYNPDEPISYAYAEATSSGNGYADSDVDIYVGDDPYKGTIVGYAISNATGTGSYANSDVYVHEIIPAGAYYDVASDGNAFAIAIMISDGSNVWGISYTDAQNGGAASAYVWSGEGTGAEARVGADVERPDE